MPSMASPAWGRSDVLLIEADGKALLAENGITIPPGKVVTDAVPLLSGEGPWMV